MSKKSNLPECPEGYRYLVAGDIANKDTDEMNYGTLSDGTIRWEKVYGLDGCIISLNTSPGLFRRKIKQPELTYEKKIAAGAKVLIAAAEKLQVDVLAFLNWLDVTQVGPYGRHDVGGNRKEIANRIDALRKDIK